MSSFISQDGSIRLVIGCLVSAADIDALQTTQTDKSESEKEVLRLRLRTELQALTNKNVNSAIMLAKLVVAGVASIKFAVRDEGIYHEKFGIFEDQQGLKVAFIGSANETDAALAFGKNHESFSVFQSVEPAIYSAYGAELEQRFERLWRGITRGTRIYDLDSDSLALIRDVAKRDKVTEDADKNSFSLPKLENVFQLREYQTDAIRAWANNQYRGILAMATGTGKTLTAIDAVKRFRAKIKGGAVVVTVPYQNLATQWVEALRSQGQDVIPVFESYVGWYAQVKNIFLASNITSDVAMPCLVCVNDTFKNSRFQEVLELLSRAKQPHHLLIVDECHHFNSPDHLRSLPDSFTYRLGLSATPYDQYAKHYLDEYFGDIVFEFPLGRAIRDGFLTPYRYHVLTTSLDDDETQIYEELTRKIVQIAGGEDGFTPETLAKAQPLLLRRARVVGAARDKLTQLERHLQSSGRTPFSLFYCGDGSLEDDDGIRSRQIELVTQLLHKLGWRTSRITAEESLRDRETLLESLRREVIDAVISIKVLDEGIDIPACRSAYLLASQSSDRQGIQRRGRVLRKSEGKKLAELFDFIVIGGTSSSRALTSLARRELRRAVQFATDAINCDDEMGRLISIASGLGIDLGEE